MIKRKSCRLQFLGFAGYLRKDVAQALLNKKMGGQNQKGLVVSFVEAAVDLIRQRIVHVASTHAWSAITVLLKLSTNYLEGR